MRGEDRRKRKTCAIVLETPPHAWGRRFHSSVLPCLIGNTPTCVGKTHVKHEGPLLVRKHPHMRGEDLGLDTSNLSKMETPPHAWGRPRGPCGDRSREGNTPTCVGKTLCYRGDLRHSWKHPHMRGEDPILICQQCGQMETPPHAWGRRERA